MTKTIHVEKVLKWANDRLSDPDSEYCTPEFRKGVTAMLEYILHETDNYHGFNFVEWARNGGCEKWVNDGRPNDNTPYLGDQTKRLYY